MRASTSCPSTGSATGPPRLTKSVARWETLLGAAMRIELPDAKMQQAFYACLADLLTMQERAANGKLTQTTGSEVYRFSNAGDCAGGVVGLALAGLLDNAVEVFDTQFHLAQDDGNWAGGALRGVRRFFGSQGVGSHGLLPAQP